MIGNTDAGQAQIDKQDARAAEKVTRMNAEAAVRTSEVTREELTERIVRIEQALSAATVAIQDLQRKYNLLLTERFNTGPTA